MKRIISWILLAVMMLSLFAGCSSNNAPAAAPAAESTEAPAVEAAVEPDENLENAITYLRTYYKTVRDGDHTPSDYQRLGTVRIGLTAYEVVYTVDCDESAVKVVKGDNGLVTIDVNEDSEVEVPYSLTATVTGTDGKTASLTWKHVLPISMAIRGAEIVDEAYALEDGEVLPYEATLMGEITAIDTPYSADYKNITVTIKVAGREDKPIMCYRMKGTGCEALVPGDIITVTGTIKNYKGKIEFDAGCMLINVEKGANSLVIPTDPQEILEAAYALKAGESLPYQVTLTGKIVGIKSMYSAQYGNVSVVIQTGEPWYHITCYRMKGEDVDKIWLFDEITVTGILKNYGGRVVEFDTGCIMEDWVDNPDPKAPSEPSEIIRQARNLRDGESLPYYCYLTGTVDSIRTKWNPVNGYVRLSLSVGGGVVDCYRLTGEDLANVKVGDTITVWGMIEKYKGVIQIYDAKLISPDDDELVDDLYDLEVGETISDVMMTGKITSIDKAYSGGYITVTMVVDGQKKKPVQCVKLSGLGAELLEVGDTIDVSGTLTNNAGSYQFASGCRLQSWTNANIPKVTTSSSQTDVLAAAALLGTGQRLSGVALEGTITQINTAYSTRYKNITVTMSVNGQSVRCNRLCGSSKVAKLGVGDVIKVKGKLWKNASGGLEFQNECKLVSCTIYEKPEQPAAGSKITIAQALALGNTDNEVRVTGTITSIENTTWGNLYINDGTGTLYIYGAYDEAGNRYDAMPTKPVVGETYTFRGPIVTYNTTVEMKNAVVEGLTAGGGSGSGSGDSNVNESSSFAEVVAAAKKLSANQYLSFDYTVTGTVSYLYDVQDDGTRNIGISTTQGDIICNKTSGTDVAAVEAGDTITVRGKLGLNKNSKVAFNGCTLISLVAAEKVEEPASGPLTCAEAAALGKKFANNVYSKNVYTVTGTVLGTPDASKGTMTISDGTGSLYIYGIDAWSSLGAKPEAGDTVVLRGVVGKYNDSPQMKYPTLVSFTSSVCTHANKSDSVTLAATCGATGLKDIICDDCGETVEKDVEIPATGAHSFAGNGPTCDNCAEPNTSYVPPVTCEHANKSDSVTLAATCGATGLKDIICDDCGETVEKDVEIPATGAHSFAGNGSTCDNCTEPNPDYTPVPGGEGGEGGEGGPDVEEGGSED